MSLRLRVLILVTAVNVAVFTAGMWFLSLELAQEREALQLEFAERLDYILRPTIDPGGELKVAQILQWPYWKDFEDAILIDTNWHEAADGRIVPRAVFLNPTGSLRRGPGLDIDAVLRFMARAVHEGQAIGGAQGLSVPIYDLAGRTWGALWFRLDTGVDRRALLWTLLPWFLGSTVLLTLGTFLLLRRFVLEPVEQLAEGARRVRGGELDTRLVVPRRRDELAGLMRSFNDMTREVQGFNERLAREVEAATARVRAVEAAAMRQRQLAAMGELAAGIAHEINNPLGGMVNAVHVLERADLDEDRRNRYLALLLDGLERVRQTVGNLLRFTPRETALMRVDLVEATRAALDLVRHRADRAGVRLELEQDPHLPAILGDRTELGQAVMNLVGNALDAIEGARPAGGGHVRVRLERLGEWVALSVEDDGPGVEPEVLERLGNLFYTTKEVGQGTGLGLALVQNIALRHGGRVEFWSRPGAGFRGQILLPPALDGEP